MSHQRPIQPTGWQSQFVITDPESQEDLSERIEPGEIPIGYLNRYVVAHDVHCAFCPPHMPHRHGFTARMKDGRIALCGRDCGRKYFGQEVARGLERALAVAERRAHRQVLIARATAGIPAVRDVIWNTWLPAAHQLEAALGALPRFKQELVRGGMDGGPDFIFSEVKVDWVATPDGGRKPIETRTEIGRVRQLSIFWASTGSLRRSYRLCRQVMDGVDEKDKRVGEEMRFRYRNDLLRSLEEGIAWLQMAQVFFTPENIVQFDRLCELKRFEGARYEMRSSTGGYELRVRDAFGVSQSFPLPDLRRIPTEADLIQPLRGGAMIG